MVQQNQQQWKNEVFQKFEIQHDNQTVVDQFTPICMGFICYHLTELAKIKLG